MNEIMIGQSAEHSHWVVCDCSGKITLCGRDASGFGSRPGDDACLLINEDWSADFEDALQVAECGGFVDLLLPAAKGAIVHVKSEELFGIPVILMSFYKNKKEYLAEALPSGDKIGKVFSHMDGYLSGMFGPCGDSGCDSAALANATDNTVRAFIVRNELIRRISAEETADDVSADVSALFEMISEKISSNAKNKFRVDFVSDLRDINVISPVDPRMFAGVTLMCAAVGARISDNGESRVMLGADANTATLKVTSKMRSKTRKDLKCSDISKLFELIPSTPVELIILDGMVREFGWDSIFECREGNSFTLRITFDKGADSDRLKFREEIDVAAEYVDTCMDYLRSLFSSQSQQQSEY